MGRTKRGVAEGEKFIAAVEAIYGAATAPEQWPFTLQAIADVFDDVGANLTYRRDDGGFGTIVSPSLLSGVEEYNREWFRHDIRSARAVERGYFIHHDVLTDQDVVSEHEIATHPFYTQFLSRFGLRWFAGISISPAPNINVAISVQRALTKPQYTEAERSLLQRLARHVEKSLRLSLQLLDAEVSNLGLREALSRLGFGVFLLDHLDRVVFSNEAGEKMIGDGLETLGRRLRLGAGVERLGGEGKTGDLSDEDTALADARPILLPRAGNSRPLAAYVIPVHSALQPEVNHFLVAVRSIVLVIDADPREPADPALVRDLLGLTLSEARVAALVASGLAPREASTKLGISEETARTVLKRVFAKAGVSKQSELSALLTKMVLR